MTLHHGDCLDVMAGMEPESVDAIVTDPPYGLEFMGKEWDRLDAGLPQENVWKGRRGKGGASVGTDDSGPASRHHVGFGGSKAGFKRCSTCGKRAFSGSPCQCAEPTWVIEYNAGPPSSAVRMGRWHQAWAEAAYRVAKPSAYLLAFGGTRTVHRMTCAIEDAGWIIRDMLVWGYASGFPKSKASLKPAWEPIVMARKPGPLRDLAIDECRIPMTAEDAATIDAKHAGMDVDAYERPAGTSLHLSTDPMPLKAAAANDLGRWPANLMLTDPIFDGGIEGVVGGGEVGKAGTAVNARRDGVTDNGVTYGYFPHQPGPDVTYGDTGTYSRFFLIPKADRADREPVLGGRRCPNGHLDTSTGTGQCWVCGFDFVEVSQGVSPRIESAHSTVCAKCNRQRVNVPGAACKCPEPEWVRKAQTVRANVHPTVKPVDLMRHLVRLVTPTGGIVLDPFGGSGTTALACELEGFPWVLIEREAEYVAIAEARLNGTQRGLGLPA